MNTLNQYFHNVKDIQSKDPDFVRNVEHLKQLIDERIESRQVSLCRYIEEYYNLLMENGGGASEDLLEKLDEAYMALLSGTSRKR